MKVKLISYTQPVSENLSVQDLIAYCARVSNPSNQNNIETSEKLIRYLIKHGHWSPLEMAQACIEIETTRDIARQILRHRSFVFQEFSTRYANSVEELGFQLREARLQDSKNRQNSIEVEDPELALWWRQAQQEVLAKVRAKFDMALKKGIAKEQARSLLPEGCTGSRLYMSGTMRSWVHYIELRTGVETQKEHREVAKACAKALEPIFPMIKEFVNG